MKKKIEFSKILVIWALVITTLCITSSYLLALFDHDSCENITVGVVSTCIAIAVSYEAKSLGEKHSRNKFGLDENGCKISIDTQSNNDEALG